MSTPLKCFNDRPWLYVRWICRTVICCAAAITFPNGFALAKNPSVSLDAVTERAIPGLACVVNVTITNASNDELQIVDLYRVPFLAEWKWKWEWNGGRRTHELDSNDVAYANPEIGPIPLAIVPVNESRVWTIVIPVPRSLAGFKSASLVGTYTPASGPPLRGQMKVQIGPPTKESKSPLGDKFVHVGIATAMESQAYDKMRSPITVEEVRTLGYRSEPQLLLAYFCTMLFKEKFDEEAWKHLSAVSTECRAIRDANLFRALGRGRVRLTQEEANAIEKDVAGKYTFSDEMIALLKNCVK